MAHCKIYETNMVITATNNTLKDIYHFNQYQAAITSG